MNIYKMKTEYIVLIAVITLVVIVGCIIMFLVNKNKNKQSSDSDKDSADKTPQQYSQYYESPSTSTSSNSQNYEEKYVGESLTYDEMTRAKELSKLVKFDRDIPNNFVRLNNTASNIIFSVYGNIIPDYSNEVRLYNNDGECLVKLKLLPKLNKVMINDWVESENVFKQNVPWPKNIIFSFTDNLIRMNNVIVYEFDNNAMRNYRFININLKGTSEIQLLSINKERIPAEEIIKK